MFSAKSAVASSSSLSVSFMVASSPKCKIQNLMFFFLFLLFYHFILI